MVTAGRWTSHMAADLMFLVTLPHLTCRVYIKSKSSESLRKMEKSHGGLRWSTRLPFTPRSSSIPPTRLLIRMILQHRCDLFLSLAFLTWSHLLPGMCVALKVQLPFIFRMTLLYLTHSHPDVIQ